jgi:hypothetical protein
VSELLAAGTDARRGGRKQFLKFLFIPFVSLVDALVSCEASNAAADPTADPIQPSSVRDSSVVFFGFIGGLLLVAPVVSKPGPYEFILSITAVVFYFLCFLAALPVVDEETEYWNALRNSNMFKSKNAIKSLNVLITSTVLFILFLSLSAFEWDHVLNENPLVEKLPQIKCNVEVCRYLQYVLAIGDEVPALGRILRLASLDGPAQFSDGPGEWLKNAIPILTVTYILGVFRYVHVHPSLHPSSKTLTLKWSGWLIEYVFDTTRAAVNFMLSGARKRFPEIRIILAHAGGTLPYLTLRLELAPMIEASLQNISRAEILAGLQSFWYDNAIASGAQAVGALLRVTAKEHILFGSDWPFCNDRVVAEEIGLLEGPNFLGKEDVGMIKFDNALALFPNLENAGNQRVWRSVLCGG